MMISLQVLNPIYFACPLRGYLLDLAPHPAHSRGQSLSVQSLLPWLQLSGFWTTSVWCRFLTKVGHAIRTLRLSIQSPSFDHRLFSLATADVDGLRGDLIEPKSERRTVSHSSVLQPPAHDRGWYSNNFFIYRRNYRPRSTRMLQVPLGPMHRA